MGTHDLLLQRFGPLISTPEVAQLLGRSVEGLRFTSRGRSELATALRAARVYIGRRVRYRTSEIADLIDRGTGDPAGYEAPVSDSGRTG